MAINGPPTISLLHGNGLGERPHRQFNDLADVCGDPHQDVGDMNMRNVVTSPQATYTAGQIITVTVQMNTNHGGWIGVRLCPSARSNLVQSCFDAHTLVNADTGYQRWWIMSGVWNEKTFYTTRWRLPAGVSCDGGCVLQMHYRTANSCVDSCAAAECGPNYAARNNLISKGSNLDMCGSSARARTEIFRDCADIRITGMQYTVKSGDYCYAIAQANGVSVDNILALNPTVNSGCTNLRIGQALCLPGKPGGGPAACTKPYIVKSGDYCYIIAQANGVSVANILAWNPAVNVGCTNLRVGQLLCLANTSG
ncbi:Lysozyme [Tetrabaena socialis]|uniref:Lysozyme n=1 Tax=Tetrabaena socialis TaxID=47790 RepID=A0A2J7ZLC5_9CHLO|nr:Lysozyme [Tetrabaena socialis]|eukprot:PNH01062.1 Lysozyme [Tetrabaena socialis]